MPPERQPIRKRSRGAIAKRVAKRAGRLYLKFKFDKYCPRIDFANRRLMWLLKSFPFVRYSTVIGSIDQVRIHCEDVRSGLMHFFMLKCASGFILPARADEDTWEISFCDSDNV